ncbi:hypothetical protein ACQEVS_06425 [Streptomyces sp. CA-181903]|uniref:hypothetical protein n=1 Tax=Streptomyces sp. CA-181903 TaxID=3240055 RepID=UPI003D91C25A
MAVPGTTVPRLGFGRGTTGRDATTGRDPTARRDATTMRGTAAGRHARNGSRRRYAAAGPAAARCRALQERRSR